MDMKKAKKFPAIKPGDKFPRAVKTELIRAYSMHGPVQSLHEGYAVILEELDEAWDEIKKKTSKRDMENLLKEFIQIGAMAQKVAEDVIMPHLDIDRHSD
jgi:NTP pyrophosphatase (non-canonical NTP hydrolase)